MKPTNTPLTCRVVRFWSVVVHSGTPQSAHLAHCEACRAYFASAQQLESALRQQASLSFVATPSGTEDRILRAIRNAAPARAEAPNSLFRYAMLGGAVAAAAVALFEYNTVNRSGRGMVASTPDYRNDAAELAAAVRALPAGVQKTVGQPATALAQDNPLQREVQNVYSDAQSALAFLRMNFLPSEAQGQPSST